MRIEAVKTIWAVFAFFLLAAFFSFFALFAAVAHHVLLRYILKPGPINFHRAIPAMTR
jgi:hypothetical protein